MASYRFDSEMLETIFWELSYQLQQHRDTHPLFVGTRDSNEAFWQSTQLELDELADSMQEIDNQDLYLAILNVCSTTVEWLMWLRQSDSDLRLASSFKIPEMDWQNYKPKM